MRDNRNDLERFLDSGPYSHCPGTLTPVVEFANSFLNWLDTYQQQVYWAERRRIEGALKQRHSIGMVRGHGLCIADLSGPGQLAIIARNLEPHFTI